MPGTSPLRILIHGHYNKRNVGDEGLLVSMVTALARHLGPVPTEMAYVADHDLALPALPLVTYRRLPNAFRGVLRYARQAHLVIFGGGSQFQDFGSPQRTRFLVKPLVLALVARRVGGAGLSLGPLQTWPGRLLAWLTLRQMRAVHVRDDESVEVARRLGVRALRGEDLLLTQRLPGVGGPHESPPLLMVSLVPFTATRRLTSAQQEQVLGNLTAALRAAGERFPWLALQGAAFEAKSDTPVLQAVVPGPAAPLSGDLAVMVQGMDRASFVLATRLHSLIFAFLLHKPTLIVCYHPKVRALAEQLGYPKHAQLTPEALLDTRVLAERLDALLTRPLEFMPARTPEELRVQAEANLEAFLSPLLKGLVHDHPDRERQRHHPVF